MINGRRLADTGTDRIVFGLHNLRVHVSELCAKTRRRERDEDVARLRETWWRVVRVVRE